MKINYWDCKFAEAEEYEDIDEDGDIWYECIYYCNNKESDNALCEVENQWGGIKAECPYAEKLSENT